MSEEFSLAMKKFLWSVVRYSPSKKERIWARSILAAISTRHSG